MKFVHFLIIYLNSIFWNKNYFLKSYSIIQRILILTFIPPIGVLTMPLASNFMSSLKCWAPSSNRYFWSIETMAIFVCNLPSLRPIQLRGPSPNGKYGISKNVLSATTFSQIFPVWISLVVDNILSRSAALLRESYSETAPIIGSTVNI